MIGNLGDREASTDRRRVHLAFEGYLCFRAVLASVTLSGAGLPSPDPE